LNDQKQSTKGSTRLIWMATC